ncbi:MAG TPA: DUF1549 and DUF1553 domain-containing protein, partial [Pirellulales bacterium]|nr:DUF1549 and DUF1553 domain-containing protein [Pirellulales bacterium]
MRNSYSICAVFLLALSAAPSGAAELAAIEVYPPEIRLTGAAEMQAIIVQATFEDGTTGDVTDEAELRLGDAGLATLNANVLSPLKAGSAVLYVTYGEHEKQVQVDVRDADQRRPVSFRNDVMPVLTKAGCNAGACHGAASGKDGFRLSLFGFDPGGDHSRILHEISGRRINLALPRESLLLEKAVGAVTHTGGKRLEKDDPHYALILQWLEAGAPDDTQQASQVERLEIFPESAVLSKPGERQLVIVRAHYSDGSDRDVTYLTRFDTNNEFVAEVAQGGSVVSHEPGEAFLSAHFESHAVGSHFIVLRGDGDFQWTELPEQNYIDGLVYDKLQKLRVQPVELSSDSQFLRRVTLDLTGRLPTVDEYQAFVADPRSDKREQWVDQLLDRSEFVDVWVAKWADLLQIRTGMEIGQKSLMRYYKWLRQQIEDEVPLNQMVHSLLASRGGTFANAPTNYYQTEKDILKTSENVAQVFLGMRLQCVQCHNHPFDRWTMDDYYGFAAFFARVGRKPGEDPRETIIYNAGAGETKHPVGGQVVAPRFLNGNQPEIGDKDRRLAMARWVTSDDNPYFARHMANMVWAHFFGRGIIEPVDDVRISNPPVNPQLLDELARRLVRHQFQLKPLIREICTSRTYQLGTHGPSSNETGLRNFASTNLRRLPAAVLLDVVSQVTETTDKFEGVPGETRAIQIADGAKSNYFLFTFGRSSRESACTCDIKMDPNLSQALHLLNGKTVHEKINNGQVLSRLIDGGTPADEIIDQLYVRCLT